MQRCELTICQVATACGTIGVWSPWSSCSATCGGGAQTRTCTNPAGSGAPSCSGLTTQSCNTQACSLYDPTAWVGRYSASGCSSTACCCAGVVTIASIDGSSSYYRITGSELTGPCGGVTTLTSTAPLPTSDNYSYTLAGASHTATLSRSANIISDSNTMAPQCSARLAKSSSSSDTDFDSSSSSSKTILIAAVAGGVGGLLLLSLALYCCCRKVPTRQQVAPGPTDLKGMNPSKRQRPYSDEHFRNAPVVVPIKKPSHALDIDV